MELVSSRDEFPFLKIFTVHPLSSLLSPMWQKLSYIYNNFFYYNNLSIIFLNYHTIEKIPVIGCSLNKEMNTCLKSGHIAPLENSGFILRTLWALSGFTNQTMGCPNTATLRLRTNYVGEYPIIPT